jgi:hypothetical protein
MPQTCSWTSETQWLFGGNLSQIKNMFGLQFQNIFSPYVLSDKVVDAKNQCYKVIPNKVSLMERDNLNVEIMTDELRVALH